MVVVFRFSYHLTPLGAVEMAEIFQAEIPVSIARRLRGFHDPPQGSATELLGRLLLLPKDVLQDHRDQLEGSRNYSPEMLAAEITSRLVHGLIHRSIHRQNLNPTLAADFQLPLADTILENYHNTNTKTASKPQPDASTCELQDLQILHSAVSHFFQQLLSIPSISKELQKQLIDLACEVLSGENQSFDECARRLAWSKTSTLLTYEMLLKVARHRIHGNTRTAQTE